MIMTFSVDHFTTKEDLASMVACLTSLQKVAYTANEMKDKRNKIGN